MKVYINQTEYCLEEGKETLKTALLRANIVQETGIAVAVNERVIPKTEWQTHPLQEGDRITVIKAVCGG
jgi:sulfur carrier protein